MDGDQCEVLHGDYNSLRNPGVWRSPSYRGVVGGGQGHVNPPGDIGGGDWLLISLLFGVEWYDL